MYEVILALHNIIRWLVLIFGVLAIGRALLGWFGKKEWTTRERKFGVFFTSAVDTQLLLGFVLYFVYSNWGLKAIFEQGMAFVMGQGEYRFFAVEHLATMILGTVFAHLGGALPKRTDDPNLKFKRAALWFGLALLVILAGIPWSRRLFPGL